MGWSDIADKYSVIVSPFVTADRSTGGKLVHASMDRFTPFLFGSHHSMEDLLTPHEAAAILRVPVSFVYERTRHNAIPLRRVGKYVRIPRNELMAWVDAQSTTLPGRSVRI